MRLKEVANVTSPEARQILVTPFDPQTAGSIRKGIEAANLNLNPMLERGLTNKTINVPSPHWMKICGKKLSNRPKKRQKIKGGLREIRP